MPISALIKQKPYEEIIYILRRHPITFVPYVLFFILLLIVPIVFYFILHDIFPALLIEPNLFAFAVLGTSIYYLSTYLFFYVYFIDYYLDVWIVTNDRIIDIEQHGLFSREITELDLFRIQDITTNVSGLIPTLFSYGNVIIKTASNNSHIIFYQVKHPDKVRTKLIELADIDRKFHLKEINNETLNNLI